MTLRLHLSSQCFTTLLSLEVGSAAGSAAAPAAGSAASIPEHLFLSHVQSTIILVSSTCMHMYPQATSDQAYDALHITYTTELLSESRLHGYVKLVSMSCCISAPPRAFPASVTRLYVIWLTCCCACGVIMCHGTLLFEGTLSISAGSSTSGPVPRQAHGQQECRIDRSTL